MRREDGAALLLLLLGDGQLHLWWSLHHIHLLLHQNTIRAAALVPRGREGLGVNEGKEVLLPAHHHPVLHLLLSLHHPSLSGLQEAVVLAMDCVSSKPEL